MIKYNNKLKRKFQVKLLSRDIKPKERIIAKTQANIKNNRKLKATGNRTPTMDDNLMNEQMKDIDRQSGISC